MKINDVEKQTGLTAKSIRYYESEGLLSVGRNEDNSYREYTEENILDLKRIKVYRYLDFSIKEIRELLHSDADEVTSILSAKAEQYTRQQEDTETKRKICKMLSKKKSLSANLMAECDEFIGLMDTDEDFADAVRGGCPSLLGTIWWSIVNLAPTFGLFIHVGINPQRITVLPIILSVIGVVIATLLWQRYIHAFKTQRERVKQKTRRSLRAGIPLAVGGLLAIVLSILFLGFGLDAISKPDNWLFYEKPSCAETLAIIAVEFPVFFLIVDGISTLCNRKMENGEKKDIFPFWTWLKKRWFVSVPLWLFVLYVSLINVNYVTDTQIIMCSTFCPRGKYYDYQDVDEVEAVFGQKNFSLHHDTKGKFYYKLTIDDNTIIFSQPTANENIERYNEDTYLELEEFDQALVKLKIPKGSSEVGYEYVDMNPIYVDRFRRIVDNYN